MTEITNAPTHDSTRTGMLEKWKQYHGITGTVKCPVYGCGHVATDGAHVTIKYHGDKQYIIPMCHEHNMQLGKTMTVRDEARPVRLTEL